MDTTQTTRSQSPGAGSIYLGRHLPLLTSRLLVSIRLGLVILLDQSVEVLVTAQPTCQYHVSHPPGGHAGRNNQLRIYRPGIHHCLPEVGNADVPDQESGVR